MFQRLLSLTAFVLATLSYTSASMFNRQPQFTIKAEKNKAFDEFCLIGTFEIKSGNIADCLEYCLENCRCQSFQISQNTECQLCSSNKEENGSLLHDKDGCVYAMYEMRHLTETIQKLDNQCSGMSCYMKYNCCQQSGLCPKNKICKPNNSLKQPWKRFICECPDGYNGDDCQLIRKSCGGYLNGPRESGMYKVVDSDNSMYEVYCHFDSDVAWTLLQSYSAANGSYDSKFQNFRKSLSENHPISENALTWSGYRLSKPRMKSIKDNSSFLMFTCDYMYKKHRDIKTSDYVQIRLRNINMDGENVDVLELNGITSFLAHRRGKIGEYYLNKCQIQLRQSNDKPFMCVHIDHTISECKLNQLSCFSSSHQYFRGYRNSSDCVKKVHRCVQNDNSTTQIWLGMHKANMTLDSWRKLMIPRASKDDIHTTK